MFPGLCRVLQNLGSDGAGNRRSPNRGRPSLQANDDDAQRIYDFFRRQCLLPRCCCVYFSASTSQNWWSAVKAEFSEPATCRFQLFPAFRKPCCARGFGCVCELEKRTTAAQPRASRQSSGNISQSRQLPDIRPGSGAESARPHLANHKSPGEIHKNACHSTEASGLGRSTDSRVPGQLPAQTTINGSSHAARIQWRQ